MNRDPGIELPSRADVCLGTDWFATPCRHRTGIHVMALNRLTDLGTRLVAGMLRFNHRRPQRASHASRNSPDTER